MIPHPSDLSLALIIGLALLGLLLLFLALIIALIALLRRRRRAKATDAGDLQESSTVSVNLSPSNSSCSRTSEQSADSGGDAWAPPPVIPAPPLPPLPPVRKPTVTVPSALEPEVVANTNVVESPAVMSEPDKDYDVGVGVDVGRLMLSDPDKAYDVGVGVAAGRLSWTQSLPTVSSLSVADLRKVPPIVAKKTSKTQAAARRAQSRLISTESLDLGTTVSSADPLPLLGPERPRPAGPTGRYVHIPPKLHREPRGWAPASHAVPAPVKRTWGRAKAKLAAEQEREVAEGVNPSVTMSNLSLAYDDNDMGSTATLT